MGVARPDDMNAAFAEAYNSGEIEQLLALYEAGAVLAPLPGRRARGEAEIREALVGLLALNGRMTSVSGYSMQVGDIALLQGEWHLSGTGPNGEPIEQRSRTAELVRQQAGGSWLYVDHPYAGDDAS